MICSTLFFSYCWASPCRVAMMTSRSCLTSRLSLMALSTNSSLSCWLWPSPVVWPEAKPSSRTLLMIFNCFSLSIQLCSWSCRRLISWWRWESSCAMRVRRAIVAVNRNVFLNESPRLLSYPYYFTRNDNRNIRNYFKFWFFYKSDVRISSAVKHITGIIRI